MGFHGVLLVYDITNEATFRHMPKWLSYVKQYAQDNIEITLVGNKVDLNDWRQVSFREGKKVLKRHRGSHIQ